MAEKEATLVELVLEIKSQQRKLDEQERRQRERERQQELERQQLEEEKRKLETKAAQLERRKLEWSDTIKTLIAKQDNKDDD